MQIFWSCRLRESNRVQTKPLVFGCMQNKNSGQQLWSAVKNTYSVPNCSPLKKSNCQAVCSQIRGQKKKQTKQAVQSHDHVINTFYITKNNESAVLRLTLFTQILELT